MHMRNIFGIFRKEEKVFTALESAIVLTAFIMVAAVFSYLVLGIGFTTSDTTKVTIDKAMKQTTSIEHDGDIIAQDTAKAIIDKKMKQINSSIELAGDVIAKGNSNKVDQIILTLQNTGQSPVDIGVNSSSGIMIISYSDSTAYVADTTWSKRFIGKNDNDDVLEQYERVEIVITVPEGSMLQSDTQDDVINREFRLEVKPKIGAIIPVSRVTPPQIDPVMNLKV